MKRVFVIHRWSGGPEDDWRPWLKGELEAKGYEVVVPEMPETEHPQIGKWVAKIAEVVGMPDENTYFVGHSIGCQTIMRYLQTLPEATKIAGAIFVAGWFNLTGLEEEGQEIVDIAQPWLKTSIDFERIKQICPDIKVLLSSNEPFGCIDENKNIFEKELNAQVIILPNKGHFTEDDGVLKLPEVLEFFK
ncbi:hypothetical protein A3J61_00585 [Candidatus Nomurabacteria bacterium RIFCSPHIGHO2_02_FULL_38_15]|uniref:Serine hydrolase family protein n=1 Tax=Candidatus Nomurabacteria bacterium RIFCSPHIGHO2_02_FULL_38_15 TaxID=1801752 RepID=A0A1F6VQQ3_9BACT|nr:MAG: hypothetical protein A3J61_00585 [Candidatus Nomurabacteria bacterium RIFCSPHIGHO2_02_FULL_38_15]